MSSEPVLSGIQLRFVPSRKPSEAEQRGRGVRAIRALKKKRGAPTTQFRRIMAFARELAEADQRALPQLIAALGRVVQSQAILEPMLHYPADASTSAYTNDTLFFSEFVKLDAAGRTFRQVASEIAKVRTLYLDRDIVIPVPWQPTRLQQAFSNLRQGGDWGRWRQDPNHQIELWEPLGIGWVYGGNHSISAGILTASGKVRPVVGYDITPIYQHVYCDGRAFRRRHDKVVIADVSSVEMAAIFEIGRLMTETGTPSK